MSGVFDIIGPVTVGPSSSHTAGALRIGRAARLLLGAEPERALITFYGSFADTWRGHGTDKAVLGGLMGLPADSPLVRTSVEEAGKRGLAYEIRTREDGRYHPNTVEIDASGGGGRVRIRASSTGGGSIRLDEMNGFALGASCELPTLVIPHEDKPGIVAELTAELSQQGYNIAAMKVSRARRGGSAVAVIETDAEVDKRTRGALAGMPGVDSVLHIPKL
jgi:L-serine dehydratase